LSLSDSHVLRSFLGSRVEVKVASGEPSAYGWLKASPLDAVTVNLAVEPKFAVGDPVEIQLSSKTSSVKIKAIVLKLVGKEATFTLPKLIRIDPPLEITRKKPDIPVTCTFRSPSDDLEYPAEVIDIAPRGIGLKAQEPLEKDSLVNFQVVTPSGPIFLTGTVVYCTQEVDSLDSFRIGVKFARLLRVDKARWTRLLAA